MPPPPPPASAKVLSATQLKIYQMNVKGDEKVWTDKTLCSLGEGGGEGPREKAAAGSVSPFKKSAGLDVFEMEK